MPIFLLNTFLVVFFLVFGVGEHIAPVSACSLHQMSGSRGVNWAMLCISCIFELGRPGLLCLQVLKYTTASSSSSRA